MKEHIVSYTMDFVVVGGGLTGICAALAAARKGLRVALCHDRSVLGGNSSSECRVWICGATGMGFNRYADETGIVSELTQENLYRNPEGNPHLWDALLLDKVWAEKNITLLLECRMTRAYAENGRIYRVECEQFCSETRYILSASLFADCTGDAVLTRIAGGETVCGNLDVSPAARARYNLSEEYASLGSTMLFYTKKCDHPVRYVAPDFAYSVEEIERILQSTGKSLHAADNGCDYWWLEYGGDRHIIQENESIRSTLTRLVYGVWNYIKNSGKFDAQYLTLEWVGSIPARRECRRALALRTFTEEDILCQPHPMDAVCHGGWPIDTHPSSGFFDKNESCQQLPIDPYGIPLSCLISKNFENLFLAGRNAGMNHLAMASARVMKTCAVEGEAIGTTAAFARRQKTLPGALRPEQIKAIQARLTADDVWIPGCSLDGDLDAAQRMRVSASPSLAPDTGAPARYLPLAQTAFLLFPPLRQGEQITLFLRSERARALPYSIALYESGDAGVYKPNRLLEVCAISLAPGEQSIALRCPANTKGNFCLRLGADEGLSIGIAREPLPGVLGVFAENALGLNLFAPAFRLHSQAEWYPCQALTDGFTRPYGGMHLWASPLQGAWIALETDAPVRAQTLSLYLDNALYRPYNNLRPQKDPLWNQYLHPALLRDFTVRLEGPEGERVYAIQENVQRRVSLALRGMPVSRIRILPQKNWGASYIAIHEVALLIDVKARDYTG